MRKEILFAIIAGILLGLVVAYGVWRANSVLKPKEVATAVHNAPSPPPGTQNEFSLSLNEPEDQDVFTQDTTKVTGLSKPGVWIAIAGESKDYITRVGLDGTFEQEVELVGGINRLVITALDESGATSVKKVTVVYSSEFDTEAGSEEN